MNNVEHFKKIATELGELYEKKNKCYGNSFADTYKKLGLISAVTRISDKFNRLCNLATNPDIDNLGESLEDTLRDMASYCIMTVMELENEDKLFNDALMRCIEREEGIVNDTTIREQDKKIRKGDVFECIQCVIMDDGSVAYVKGKKYVSEKDGCITNDEHDENNEWRIQEDGEDNWWNYFKRV
jgi:NTP pyrophosphatase (non-canonical NTP hydrolase)